MTLVIMKQQQFDALEDEGLGWACMEPTFLQIRGKEMSVKAEAISRLTEGQRALCMFRVLYDHANHSATAYYAWICYMLDIRDYWAGVMGGLRFFGDRAMVRLLEDTQEALEARNRRLGLHWSDATVNDLDHDEELRNAVSLLFDRFEGIAPDSLKQISAYIRANPQQFVIIEN